jgi:hypothetical protein
MYIYEGTKPTVSLGSAWTFDGLGQVIDASIGARLLDDAAVSRAVAANRENARQLRWGDLYVPISLYYLRYRDTSPTESEFAQAIARWQSAVRLPMNGILDATTWNMMRPRGEPVTFNTASGVARPNGYAQVIATFGDPTQNHADWERQNIVNASAPTGRQFQIALDTGTVNVNTVRVHRLVRDHWEALFRAIAGANLWDAIQPIGGTYNYRAVRDATQLSMHSWGLAIDIRPTQFTRGQSRSYPDPRVVAIFQDFGFHWGIFFTTPDPMHFQFATGA